MSSSLFSLEGKNVAVVGAGSGIGRAVAIGCAQHGGRVVCLDLDVGLAREAADAISTDGPAAEADALDLRDGDSVEAAFSGIASRLGSLDVVVCTPGVNVRKPLLDYTDDDFHRVVDLNLRGNLNVMKAAFFAPPGPSGQFTACNTATELAASASANSELQPAGLANASRFAIRAQQPSSKGPATIAAST